MWKRMKYIKWTDMERNKMELELKQEKLLKYIQGRKNNWLDIC